MFSFFKNKQTLKNFELFLTNVEDYPFRKIKYESVKSLQKIFHEVQILVMQKMVDETTFLETLKDIKVGVATSSNSYSTSIRGYFSKLCAKNHAKRQ